MAFMMVERLCVFVCVCVRGGVWLRVEVDGMGMVYRGEMM